VLSYLVIERDVLGFFDGNLVAGVFRQLVFLTDALLFSKTFIIKVLLQFHIGSLGKLLHLFSERFFALLLTGR